MMKRQNIADRGDYEYTHEDKELIAKKSGGVCAHCGKKIEYMEYGGQATIDHFVPLSKGGVNRIYNTVMLCCDCNKKKTNRIVAPDNYLRFIAPEYKKEINNYFDGYLNSFDYVSRQNLLALDMYTIGLFPENLKKQKKRLRMDVIKRVSIYFDVARAFPDDIPMLEEFFISYLKKHGHLKDEDDARENVRFWARFGTIYYIKDRVGDIRLMMPILMHLDDEKTYAAISYIFSSYATDMGCTLADTLVRTVMSGIRDDQNVPYIRMIVLTYRDDKISKVFVGKGTEEVAEFYATHMIMRGHGNYPDFDGDESRIPFYSHFTDIRYAVDNYLKEESRKGIDYMRYDLYTPSAWEDYWQHAQSNKT